MATKQQIPKIVAALVEFQDGFNALSTYDAQFVIQRTEEAIKIFVSAIQKHGAVIKNVSENASPVVPVPQIITSTSHLRLIAEAANLSLGSLEPRLIAEAKDVFKSHIDSDFVNYGLNKLGVATKPIKASGYELYKNGTIREIFNSFGVDLENLWLSQSQIIDICVAYPQKLRREGHVNLFLMKKDELLPATEDNLFVAGVSVVADGLYVFASRFSDVRVWRGENGFRVFVPLGRQLIPLAT